MAFFDALPGQMTPRQRLGVLAYQLQLAVLEREVAMYRLVAIVGLGVALTCIVAPASAQDVQVDVGVDAGPVAGRVIYGSPHRYPVPPPHHRYPAYDWEHAREQAKHEREMRKELQEAEREYWKDVREAEREYWKDVREFEREEAKAIREHEREHRKRLQEEAREYRKRQHERDRDYWKN